VGSKRDKSRLRTARGVTAHAAPGNDLLLVVAAPTWQWLVAALTVAAAAVVVYLPTLHNEFVTWDDPDYITKNAYVTSPDGLAAIWNPRTKQQQYYPLVFSSYWVEYRLWGDAPSGYHATNFALHAINAALIVLLLRQLGLSPWAAWLAAALFAVHPLNAASVAWAAERKNVLSLLFYLLALLCYLRQTRGGSWVLYALAGVLFVLGLLSKTAVVTFPATALVCDRLILRRWTLRSFARTAPLLLLGLLAAALTHHVEARNAGTNIVRLEPWWRPFAAAGAVWFYIGKVFVPTNLAGVYERWDLRAHWPVFAAALAAVPAAVYAVWRWRRRLPPQVPWGLGHYVLSLGPMLGLVSFNYTQFSFVADHFVYLPVIGLFAAIAALAEAGRVRIRAALVRRVVPTALAVGVLAVLGTLTWRQCATLWHDARSFWEETCRMSPGGWVGHYNLGNLYIRTGQTRDSAEHYRRAAAAKPDLHQAYGSLGEALALLGDRAGALEAYRRGIATVPYDSKKWVDYRHGAADVLLVLGRKDEAEKYLREAATKSLYRAQIRLGRYLRDERRYSEAAAFYQAAGKTKDAAPLEVTNAQRELAALPREAGAGKP
jgi:tetratricopeptide (TPR) repeat protein